MRRIWKFGPFIPGPSFVVDMPLGAEIVHFTEQYGRYLCVWALVDPEAPLRGRHLLIVGTGHPCPDHGYVRTCVSGDFVWHLFDGGGLPLEVAS